MNDELRAAALAAVTASKGLPQERALERLREIVYPAPSVLTEADRVQVHFPDTRIAVNVYRGGVEWGTNMQGNNGADIEIGDNGGMTFRFHSSSRMIVADGVGVRVYDADSPRPEALIINFPHGPEDAPPFHLGPAAKRD